jgi:hypothetical protein
MKLSDTSPEQGCRTALERWEEPLPSYRHLANGRARLLGCPEHRLSLSPVPGGRNEALEAADVGGSRLSTANGSMSTTSRWIFWSLPTA